MTKHLLKSILFASLISVITLSGCSKSNTDTPQKDPDPIIEPEKALEFKTCSGTFNFQDFGAASKGTSSNLAIITNRSFTKGTIKMNVKANGSKDSGFIFCADSTANSYYFLKLNSVNGNKLVLVKHTNNYDSELGSCYLTAGYSTTSSNELKIIYDNGKIQSFWNDKLFVSRTDASPLTGSYVGVKTDNYETVYKKISVSDQNTFNGVDTLITGHSYMELWSNYKTDLSRYTDIHNIGIGGTASTDWMGHVNEVVDYHPTKLIYMIGINDVGRGTTPEQLLINIKAYVNPILEQLPNTKVCLVSVNMCPQYKLYKTTITEINRLLWNYVYETNRTCYANVDDAFLKNDGTPDDSCFTDGLHPATSSYLVIRNAIYDAFDGINQPTEPKPAPGEPSFDLKTGKAVISEIKTKYPSTDWVLSDNTVTTKSVGHLLTNTTFNNFSAVLEFSNCDSSNPFFTHIANKSFLFGGSELNGKYKGYTLDVCQDWLQILYLDGTSNYSSTFVGAMNVNPTKTKFKLTINGAKAYLTYGNGDEIGKYYGDVPYITLNNYEQGSIGFLRNNTQETDIQLLEIK